MSTEKKFRVDAGIETPQIVFPDGSIQSTAYTTPTQYGFLNEMTNSSDGNRVDGEAVLVDSGGNTYVSYTYYDNNDNKRYGGIVKFDNTGSKLYSVNIIPADPDGEYSRITSLEYAATPGGNYVVAIGYYYNNNTSRDVGFMCMINPDNGSTGTMFDILAVADYGIVLNDAVFGPDSGNSPYAVIVGNSYNEALTKTLTPLTGSTTDKLLISWSEFNNSGLLPGDQVYYTAVGYYPANINSARGVPASIDGTYNTAPYMFFDMSYTQAGEYVILGVGGWGGNLYDWPSPVTLKVLGSNLGGVDGVNDFTFDFDPVAFNNNGNNINIAVSNKQGTPISDVYCQTYYGFDWSTEVGNPLSFEYRLNNQGYIARLGFSNNWSKSLGSSNYENFNSVVVDSNDNIYAVGTYYDNISRSGLVVKYDITGAQQWAVYIDPSDNLGIEVYSVDLLSDGNLICVAEDAIVTKINYTDGSIIWQVKITDYMSWDSDFKGTATPEGDYIFTNYEDNNYRLYVMRVSGVDGSVMWSKEIKRYFVGSDGEIYPQNYFQAQYIDCNSTHVSIGATTYLYFNNNSTYAGLTINFPSDGSNTDGTYGQYIISPYTFNWETKSTTSVNATLNTLSSSVNLGPSSPSSSNSNLGIATTIIGAGPTQPYALKNGDNTLYLDNTSKYAYWQVGSSNVALAGIRGNDEFLLDSLTGNVVISSNDSHDWTFDTSGNLNTPGSISVSGDVSAYNFSGDGGNLSNIQVGNISGLGNVATANLDNSASNVLYGNGTFAPLPSSSGTAWANIANINNSWGPQRISVGQEAGNVNPSNFGIALGYYAGHDTQGNNAIAIGLSAGQTSQGDNAIAIGTYAGQGPQAANSIILNASGSSFTSSNSGFYVNPVRNDTGNTTNVIYYNTSTNELTYGPAPSGSSYGDSNVSSLLASFGSNTITTTGKITADGGGLSNVPYSNVTGLGNIVTINKDGNASNILYGNGVFAAASSGGSNYNNSNVATFLASFGSNAISTTGNISAGNISISGTFTATGNISTSGKFVGDGSALTNITANVSGNIIGTSPNVTLVAGSYSTTFDNTGNVTIPGNVIISGTTVTGVNSILAGPTFTPLANTMAGFVSNVNNYTQLTIQNKNTGADATTDFIATADNGSDTVNYLDLGIINSGYDNGTPTNSLGNIVFAADSYIYAQGNVSNTAQSGGNLAIGTSVAGKTVKIFAGGVTSSNIVAAFANTGVAITGTLSATANISTPGYFISGNQATGGFQLGNVNSRIQVGGGNSYMTFGQNPSIYPDTALAAGAGLLIGGGGYILAPNGSRVITLGTDGSLGVTANINALNGGNISTTGSLLGGNITASGSLTRSGTLAANAWTTNGIGLKLSAATFNELNAPGGTVANSYIHVMGTPTLIASNATTYTNYSTLFVAQPTPSTNVTITNNWAIMASGNVSVSGNLVGGNVTTVGQISATGTITSSGSTNGTGFAVGNGAVSNCALAMTPTAGTAGNYAIRDYSTANSIMYFDTTIGSANTGGSFQFRSSNSFTVLANVNQFGISTPNLAAFRVYGTVSTPIASGNTITSTNGVTVDYNQGSYYNNSTGIFTAPIAGLYHCFGTVRVGTNNGLNQAAIIKNGTTLGGANTIAFWETDTNTGTASHFPLNGYTKCAVGDTIRLHVVAGNVEFDSNDSWGVTYIG